MIAAGLCLLASALLVRWMWVWHPPVTTTDLTRPHEYLCQVTREPNNQLSLLAYEARMEARGLAPIREIRHV